MATWKALVHVNAETGRNWVEVDAVSANGARQIISNMYGTDNITHLQIKNDSGSSSRSSGGGSIDGSWALVGLLFLIWVCFEYAHIALPILAILFLGWVAQITQRWWDTD